MTKFVFTGLLLLASCCAAFAQSNSFSSPSRSETWLSGPSAQPNPLLSTRAYAEALMSSAPLAPSPAAPEPAPRLIFGSRDDYRWQLSAGYEYVRFRSALFEGNLHGLRTSLTYYTNDWFGVEGNIVAAFGPTIFANDRTKYFLYTFGPKIVWRGHKWEPWSHALFGGLHMLPQFASNLGQNGFALQLGGGADYRFLPQLSARFEADYVRSQLYSASQNNVQFGSGIVLHF